MKLVKETPEQEDIIVVTEAEIKEFQRIGALLAQVVDARLGTSYNKVSVEAQGYMRIISWNIDSNATLVWPCIPEYLYDAINDLEVEEGYEEEDDDDDDDDDYDDDNDESPAYQQATDFKRGVRVQAVKDITCADIYSPTDNPSIDSFVIVPKGTFGVVLDLAEYTKKPEVAFEVFNIGKLRNVPSSWMLDNRRVYDRSLLEIPTYWCQCSFCLKRQLKLVDNFPL